MYGTFGLISFRYTVSPHSKQGVQNALGTCWTVDGIPFLPG